MNELLTEYDEESGTLWFLLPYEPEDVTYEEDAE
jgi:hypothetical protein